MLSNEQHKIINKQKTKYYDLTADISETTVVFPGDPKFKQESICTLGEEGSQFNLCHMHFGNHTGTHIDFPAHVIKGGKTSNDYLIDHFIGAGLIIEVPDSEKSVSRDFVKKQNILRNDFVFFKTANSLKSKYEDFDEKYVYIEPRAADELLKIGVKIVGIDYISVDQYEAESLPVHQSLLSNDVLIVEGLELKNIPSGRCKVYIMPVKVSAMDGLPVRVVAEI